VTADSNDEEMHSINQLDVAEVPWYKCRRNQPQPGGTRYLGDGSLLVQFTVTQDTKTIVIC
jgi:hypothetical protein